MKRKNISHFKMYWRIPLEHTLTQSRRGSERTGKWVFWASSGKSSGKRRKCEFLWCKLFLQFHVLFHSFSPSITHYNTFYHFLCSGLDNSGKTTIVLKINGEDTSVISPTLGFNIKTITYQKYFSLFTTQSHTLNFFSFLILLYSFTWTLLIFGRYTLNIWDVGGQKTIRSYWRNYFEQTDGLVWVVDSSDLRRLDDCKLELDNLLKEEVCSIPLFITFQLNKLVTCYWCWWLRVCLFSVWVALNGVFPLSMIKT